jgi:AraC-like DNA-binding protein
MGEVFETTDMDVAEHMLASAYGRMRISATRGQRHTLRLAQDRLGPIRLDDVSFTMGFHADGTPLGTLVFGHVTAGLIRNSSDGTERCWGPGQVFLTAQPDHPYTSTIEDSHAEMAIIDPALLNQVADGERDGGRAWGARQPVRFTGYEPISPRAAQRWRSTYAYLRDTVLAQPAQPAQPVTGAGGGGAGGGGAGGGGAGGGGAGGGGAGGGGAGGGGAGGGGAGGGGAGGGGAGGGGAGGGGGVALDSTGVALDSTGAMLDSPRAAGHPLVAASAARLLVATALTVFPHNAVTEPTVVDRHDAHPATLRRAIAYIDEHAQEDITLADIADAACVSIRAVQFAFRRHLDITPMAYLRRVRLSHAHHDLVAADPARTTVTQIASRWGFPTPSRFTTLYRQAHGVTPSYTLHH